MKIAVSKYELWNALFMCAEEQKSDNIKDLEKELNNKMKTPGHVVIDIRDDSQQ